MPLTIKIFIDKGARDREYYELAKTRHDVMRYGDQEPGEFEIKGVNGVVKREPGRMIWCIAYGNIIKTAPIVEQADSGIPALGLEGGIEGV